MQNEIRNRNRNWEDTDICRYPGEDSNDPVGSIPVPGYVQGDREDRVDQESREYQANLFKNTRILSSSNIYMFKWRADS